MAHLQVKVTNSFGTFEGKVTLAANSDSSAASQLMRDLITGINSMDMLSIEGEDGEATVFGETVLKESVITVKTVN